MAGWAVAKGTNGGFFWDFGERMSVALESFWAGVWLVPPFSPANQN